MAFPARSNTLTTARHDPGVGSPFQYNAVRFRHRDKQTMIVVAFTDGSRVFVRVDPRTAAIGGERLLAVLRERQVSGELPGGVIAEITRSR
jgi:hypothetical protein